MIDNAKGLLHEVTGIRFLQFSTKKRSSNYFFAWLLFAHTLLKSGIRIEETAKILKRAVCSIDYYEKVYQNEARHNEYFRKLANKVSALHIGAPTTS